jgi:hypothetical protein
MSFSIRTFGESFASFLRLLAMQWCLKIVYGGYKAETDGKTVWLPCLPLNLNDDHAFLVKAHGHHEVAHCIYTDFVFFREFGVKYGPSAQRMLNCIEDPRIEFLHVAASGSAGMYLGDKPVVLERVGRLVQTTEENAFNVFCLFYLQTKQFHQYIPYANDAESKFVEFFGGGAISLIEKVKALLDQDYPLLTSTKDAGDLVLKLRELLENHEDNDNQEKPTDNEGEDDDSDQQSDADSDSDSDDEQSKDGDSDGDDKGEAEGGGSGSSDESENEDQSPQGGGSESDDEKDMSDDSDSDTSGSGQSNSEDNTEDMKQKIQQILHGDPGEMPSDLQQFLDELCEEIEKGDHEEYLDAPTVPAGEHQYGNKASAGTYESNGTFKAPQDHDRTTFVKSTISANSHLLSAMLQQLLESTQDTDLELGRFGILQSNQVYRAGMGRADFFATHEEEEGLNSAVLLLNDLSGSTKFNGGECALGIQQTTLLLAQALDSIQLPIEICGFGHNDYDEGYLVDVKGFDESLMSCESRIGGMDNLVGGGTPLKEALFEAGLRMEVRQEAKKMLYIATDGDPYDLLGVVGQVKLLEQQGIDVHFLVLGEAKRFEWLERDNISHSVIEEVIQLPDAILKQMQQSLFG